MHRDQFRQLLSPSLSPNFVGILFILLWLATSRHPKAFCFLKLYTTPAVYFALTAAWNVSSWQLSKLVGVNSFTLQYFSQKKRNRAAVPECKTPGSALFGLSTVKSCRRLCNSKPADCCSPWCQTSRDDALGKWVHVNWCWN